MKNKTTYIVLFATLMAILFLPIGQKYIFKIDIKPLNGEWVRVDKPKLTFENYKSNEYQKNIEKYISENFGFKEFAVRLYNEYLWDVFHKTYVKNIVRGDEGWIFYKDPVSSYYGRFQHGKYKSNEKAAAAYDDIALNMWKLRNVMKDFNIEFITFFTPDKCRLYDKYIPRQEADTTTINAAEYFKENFKKYDIPNLDMTEVFREIGDTLPFPLIGPGGAHWNFSCIYAIDTILQYAGDLMGTKIAKIECGPLKRYDRKMTKDNIQDFDAEGMLNLLFMRDHSQFQLYKADVSYENNPDCTKPSMLFVGNSFFWRPLDLIEFDSIVSNRRFWYYNNTAYAKGTIKPTTKLDYLNEILQSDCIFTFCSETQLHEMSFGFVNKALISLCVSDSIMQREISRLCEKDGISKEKAEKKIYKNPSLIPELAGEQIPTIRNEKAIERFKIINEIESDSSWMAILEGHSKYRKKSLKYMVIEEMMNIISNKPLLKDMDIAFCEKQYNEVVNDIITNFRNNKNLARSIKEKAEKRGCTFEEMLHIDAVWTIDYDEQKFLPKIYNVQ